VTRLPRHIIPGQPYHVIQRGVNRSAVFVRPTDHAFFRDRLAAALERYRCQLHAYVLMTNHVHLLVTPSGPSSIAQLIQSVSRRYVPWFNKATDRTGTLWSSRYRATVIDSDHYLLACYRYIELNPVRAGMVADPEDYQWSSYRANALGMIDSLITPHALYAGLGADLTSCRSAYRALFCTPVEEETLRDLRAATRSGRQLSLERRRQELMALEGSVRGGSCRERPELHLSAIAQN
jgi:putative transposase